LTVEQQLAQEVGRFVVILSKPWHDS